MHEEPEAMKKRHPLLLDSNYDNSFHRHHHRWRQKHVTVARALQADQYIKRRRHRGVSERAVRFFRTFLFRFLYFELWKTEAILEGSRATGGNNHGRSTEMRGCCCVFGSAVWRGNDNTFVLFVCVRACMRACVCVFACVRVCVCVCIWRCNHPLLNNMSNFISEIILVCFLLLKIRIIVELQ